MSLFLALFLVGTIGFLAMALLSAGHFGGHSSTHTSGHSLGHGTGAHGVGHGHSGGPHFSAKGFSAKGFSTKGFSAKGAKASNSAGPAWAWILSALAPMQIFVLCLGFGATGMLIHRYAGTWTITGAIVGALILNFLIVKPLMGLLMQWQSTPSDGLEGTVASEAEAICAFDADGKGLVRLTLDGQHVQLLATLESNEHHRGVVISKGDKVVILEVDATKNQCRVSRELSVA